MKALPPVLRVNKRYILAKIQPPLREDNPEYGRELYYAVYEAAASLYGDAGAGELNLSVVYNDRRNVIIQCTRGTEIKLQTALAALNKIAGKDAALRSVKTSGTIAALKRSIEKQQICLKNAQNTDNAGDKDEADARLPEKVEIAGKVYTPVRLSYNKVDLYRDEIKNQDILYFTLKDIEEL